MDDLISKEDVCEILADMYPTDGEAVISYKEIDKAYAKVRNLSTIDAAPVVHGRWDDSLDGITPYCSICHMTHKCFNRTPNYCPTCGAKMDLEDEQ